MLFQKVVAAFCGSTCLIDHTVYNGILAQIKDSSLRDKEENEENFQSYPKRINKIVIP